jgi:coproporphyrinogen III oxidase
VEWLRDGGRHGGGDRLACGGTAVFDRASINVSSVHYDDEPDRVLSSATALSTIIHPRNPHAASVHMHHSWTEMREGGGYWRMMADLNPAIPDANDTRRFVATLRAAAGEVYAEASAQGDRYFQIPALDRHRGVAHFYLEGYSSGDFEVDAALARGIGEAVIDCYAELLQQAISRHPQPSQAARSEQLAYHTLYLFQVLTLDRGTTSGLLVHDQNDVGILGSLPGHVDRDLLASWATRVEAPQDALVRALVEALPDANPCPVDDATRQGLAAVLREHYCAYPEALELQASGNSIPPTVSNHGRA